MTNFFRNDNLSSELLIVTGVSGAGKSSALGALEDLGFEAIDNVPIYLLGRLISPGSFSENLAIGIDIRTRDFNSEKVLLAIENLISQFTQNVSILFLDCDDEILLRRFKETRRRHPLAVNKTIAEGINDERRLLKKLKERSDTIIDTSEMVLGNLKETIILNFKNQGYNNLSIFLMSFGYRNGLPRNADLVFDVRFLKNPFYDLKLKELDGKNTLVAQYIREDVDFNPFYNKLTELLEILVERYQKEGKNYLTIAFGCTGGRHRSVYMAETLALWFKNQQQSVQVQHRDL